MARVYQSSRSPSPTKVRIASSSLAYSLPEVPQRLAISISSAFASESLASYVSYASTTTDTNNAFASLGTAMGAAMIGPLIESFVQPAEVIRRLRNSPDSVERIKSMPRTGISRMGLGGFKN
jgi:hypothetical protein